MDEPTANPIAERLIHADRGPGPRASRWIGWGAGLAGGGSLLVWLMALPNVGAALLAAQALPALEMLLLALCFILAALMMSGFRRAEDYALLHLTHLEAPQVVNGCSAGIRYRLRILRMAAVALPVGWGLALVVIMATARAWVCVGSLLGGAALLAWLSTELTTALADRVIEAGVWLGLRRGREAVTAASGIGLALVALMLALPVMLHLDVLLVLLCHPMLWLSGLAVLNRCKDFFQLDAIRAAEEALSP